MDDATKAVIGAAAQEVGEVAGIASTATGGATNPVGLALLLISILATNVPRGIQDVQDIMDAWGKADPTGEDFDALALAIDAKRPKDPLAGKETT